MMAVSLLSHHGNLGATKMTLSLSQLHSQRHINRQNLRHLYDMQQFYKAEKKDADTDGRTVLEYAYHNRLKQLKKEIATLVSLQKSLKSSIAVRLENGRFIAEYKKAAKERREVTAAKWAAMDRAGETL